MVIPERWRDDRSFWERLDDCVVTEHTVNARNIAMVVEPPRPPFFHACTPEDILRVLRLLPQDDLGLVDLVVLRQPKRKEVVLSEVWGRAVHWADLGIVDGPSVYLEAQTLEPRRWPRSLRPHELRELERLRHDGHRIESDRRHHVIHSTADSIRATQLFRTIPHEIAHHVDYERRVNLPGADDPDERLRLQERYFARPGLEREDFAHRYAAEFAARQRESGQVPFERIFRRESLRSTGMDPAWFTAEHAA